MNTNLGRIWPWAAVGVMGGIAVAVKAANVGEIWEHALVANGQWFALAAVVGPHLSVWVPLGLGVGLAMGLIHIFVFAPRSPQRRNSRILCHALSLAGASAIILSAIVVGASIFRPRPEGPNILLVVLDTARRDRFSLYGYHRPTSPHLKSLAKDSTVFTEAYSTSSWTPPAHASLFTGFYSCAHHVTQESWFMGNHLVTLAEALWEMGYRTAAMVANAFIHENFGFAQGFEEFHGMWRQKYAVLGAWKSKHGTRDEHRTLRQLETFLDTPSDRPFFVFLNFIEPHNPYDSSRQYFDRYIRHRGIDLVDPYPREYFTGRRAFSPEELEHLGDLYDAEIQYTDFLVGKIEAMLRERGILEDTVLVVTSDHGENLGDHGMVAHNFNLYETTIQIPLLIRYPKVFPPGTRDPSHIQLVDLFPTLLHLAGANGRFPSQGVSLVGSPPGSIVRPFLTEYYYPVKTLQSIGEPYAHSPLLDPFKRRIRAVREGELKLILGDDGRAELYNLAVDPAEHMNLAARPGMKKSVAQLSSLLMELVQDCSPRRAHPAREGPPGIDEETRRELRALGYVR